MAVQIFCDECQRFTEPRVGNVTGETFCFECGTTYTCAECSGTLTLEGDCVNGCGAQPVDV